MAGIICVVRAAWEQPITNEDCILLAVGVLLLFRTFSD